MEISDFNKYYLSNPIETLFLENKKIVLLDDFNVDLLNYDSNYDASDFLDTITNKPRHVLIPFVRYGHQKKTAQIIFLHHF